MKDEYYCDTCHNNIDDRLEVCPVCGTKTDNSPFQKVSEKFKTHADKSHGTSRSYTPASKIPKLKKLKNRISKFTKKK